MEKYFIWIPYTLLALGIFFLGVFSGLVYQINNEESIFCPVNIITKEKVSVLEITEISPFGIKGNVDGNILRISNGEDILDIEPENNFQLNTSEIFRNIQAVIPKDAMYFASKRGKKLYPVDDTKQLESIRPENILFFYE